LIQAIERKNINIFVRVLRENLQGNSKNRVGVWGLLRKGIPRWGSGGVIEAEWLEGRKADVTQ
jgi:hypothetical protein